MVRLAVPAPAVINDLSLAGHAEDDFALPLEKPQPAPFPPMRKRIESRELEGTDAPTIATGIWTLPTEGPV